MKIEHLGEIWKWVVIYTKEGNRISYKGYYKISSYGMVEEVV